MTAARDGLSSGSRPGLVLLLASTATFVAFLDVTVVHVAFPDLRQDFATASISTLSWVVTGYAVAFAALLTPAGRLADALGRRRVFLLGLALFVAASAACAMAWSVPSLIVARAIQGFAGATMIPAALGLVLAATPTEGRARAIGLWAAAASVAAAAGPSLGGLLVESFGWRAVFLVNVPIGLAVLAMGRRVFPEVRRADERLPDLLGVVVAAVALGAIVVALTKAGDWGWASPTTLITAAIGAVLLIVAVARARRHAAPALELSLYRRRMFTAANLTVLIFGAAVYSWMLLCIIFLTSAWDYSVLTAGLAVTHGALASMVGAVLTGRISDWRKRRAAVVVGAIVLAADGIWLSEALTGTPNYLGIWFPAGLLAGLGMGAVLTGVASAAALSLPPERFAAGTGMEMTARELGGAIGVAALAAILEAQNASFGAMMDVFVFTAVAASVAAVAALRLSPAATATALDQEPLAAPAGSQ